MAHRGAGGQSKAEGKTKLVTLHDELCEALHTSATYTVRHDVRGLVGERARWAVGQDASFCREVLDLLTGPIG